MMFSKEDFFYAFDRERRGFYESNHMFIKVMFDKEDMRRAYLFI